MSTHDPNVVDAARIDANWRAITAELDTPRPSRVERWLRRVGVPAHLTRVALGTPALRRAWFVSIAVVALIGLAAGRPGDRSSYVTLVALAPILPVVGVAMAYGPADPMYEVQLATPVRGVRLVAMRAAVVLGVTAAIVGGLALLSPAVRPAAALWLVPALAATLATLALATWRPPRQAAAVVAIAWLLAVVLADALTGATLAAVSATGQLVTLAVAAAATAVVVARRGTFDRIVMG